LCCALALCATDAAIAQSGSAAPDTSNLPIYTMNDITMRVSDIGAQQTSTPRAGGPKTIFASTTNQFGPGFFVRGPSFLTDDYQGVGADATTGLQLQTLAFEGGVTVAGMVAFFVFFDANDIQLDGFGIQFPRLGVQRWEFIDPSPLSPVLINEAGFLKVVAATAAQNTSLGIPSTVVWSQSAIAPSLGFNSGVPGAGTGIASNTVYGFDITVTPTPGAGIALLLTGLAGAARRRRSAA